MLNCSIGKYGEDLSVDFLYNLRYEILERNYRCKIGEIDIICKNENTIIFVEVKTRYTDKFGSARCAINYQKRKNIINVSKYYLLAKYKFDYLIRYDVIEVFLTLKKDIYNINHIIDAFRLN